MRVTRNNEQLREKSDISRVIFEEHLVTLRTFSKCVVMDSETLAGAITGSRAITRSYWITMLNNRTTLI